MMDRKAEITAVKQLGEKIGYGNLMDITSALWAIQLQKNKTPKSGAFVPVLIYDIKTKLKKRYEVRQSMIIHEIKALKLDYAKEG